VCPFEATHCVDNGEDGFNALTDLLVSLPLLHSSHFVFVPGPLDPWSSTTLPRPALPATFSARLTQRIPKARFVSNPCRLRYFGQELVVCREDLMGRMVRNLVGVKQDEGVDMKRYVGIVVPMRKEVLIPAARPNNPRPSASIPPAFIHPSDVVGV